MIAGMLVTHRDHPGIVFTLDAIHAHDLAGLTARDLSCTYDLVELDPVDRALQVTKATSPTPLPPCPACGTWVDGVTKLVGGEWVKQTSWQQVGKPCEPGCTVGHIARTGLGVSS